jgi:hypothetical protein
MDRPLHRITSVFRRPGLGGLQGAAGSQAGLGAQQRLGAGGSLAPTLQQQMGLGQAPGGRVGVPGQQQFANVNGERTTVHTRGDAALALGSNSRSCRCGG